MSQEKTTEDQAPEARLRRYCWLTPGIAPEDEAVLLQILAAAEEQGRRAGLEEAAGIARGKVRFYEQADWHCNGATAAASIAEDIRARIERG